MKIIATIIRVVLTGGAFIIGGFFLLAAIVNIDEETTSAIAQGVIATALILVATAMTIEHRLTEIKRVAERQNKLLEKQIRIAKSVNRNDGDKSQSVRRLKRTVPPPQN